MTKIELAKKLKKKYPQYRKLSDNDAADALLVKYPSYRVYLDADDPYTPIATADSPHQALQDLDQLYEGNMEDGGFTNFFKSRGEKQRANLLEHKEAQSLRIKNILTNQNEAIQQVQNQKYLRHLSHNSYTETLEQQKVTHETQVLQLQLIEGAKELGLDTPAYIQRNLEAELKVLDAEYRRKLKQIDLDAEHQGLEWDAKAIMTKLLAGQHQLAHMQELIFKVYDRLGEIEASSDPKKEAKLAVGQRLVKGMEDYLDAFQKHLALQSPAERGLSPGEDTTAESTGDTEGDS